jgi:hypothetical protein
MLPFIFNILSQQLQGQFQKQHSTFKNTIIVTYYKQKLQNENLKVQ